MTADRAFAITWTETALKLVRKWGYTKKGVSHCKRIDIRIVPSYLE